MQAAYIYILANGEESNESKDKGIFKALHLAQSGLKAHWLANATQVAKYKLDAETKVTKRFKNPRPAAVASQAKRGRY